MKPSQVVDDRSVKRLVELQAGAIAGYPADRATQSLKPVRPDNDMRAHPQQNAVGSDAAALRRYVRNLRLVSKPAGRAALGR